MTREGLYKMSKNEMINKLSRYIDVVTDDKKLTKDEKLAILNKLELEIESSISHIEKAKDDIYKEMNSR